MTQHNDALRKPDEDIPPMPEFDMSIVAAIFHDSTEAHGNVCVHRNQHFGGKDCGEAALDFVQEYARRWSEEYSEVQHEGLDPGDDEPIEYT